MDVLIRRPLPICKRNSKPWTMNFNRYLLTHSLFLISVLFTPLLAQTTWVVNTVDDNDDGTCDATHCSLREAIDASNANAGADIITFNIGGAGPFVIEPVTPLPVLTDPQTTIDGTTQPAYTLGDIVIDGTNTAPLSHGLNLAASNTEVYGMKVVNFDESNNAGIFVAANNQLSDIVIGGPGRGNIIGGSHQGIFVSFISDCNNITIQSNYIGVDPSAGMANIGNTINGVVIMQGVCTNVLIGGDATLGEGNVIGFNSDGIRIRVEGVVVQGNAIGTDPAGTMDLGNTGFGVNLDDQPGTPNNCLIGGPGEGLGNLIAYNNVGIFKFPTGTVNRFQRNGFFCNGAGILYQSSTTNGTAPPAILCVSTGLVEGKAAPNTVVEVFQVDNADCPNNNACQGRFYLGETITDANGDWSVPIDLNVGDVVGATATDLSDNTSPFGNCTIIQNELVAVAENPGPFCFGSPIELQGSETTGQAGLTFTWTGPNNYTSTGQSPNDATEAGTYVLEVTDNTCGRSVDSTVVEVLAAITSTIGDDPSEILCPTESIVINGTTYDINNPTGTESMPGQGGACDTIVTVQLQFHPEARGTLNPSVCEGQSFSFNGTDYDAANPSGTEVLSGAAANGCDSIVDVTLTFIPSAQGVFNTTICPGASLVFNGTTYDENNPTGVETLMGQAANGCDSVVTVTVDFFPVAMGVFEPEVCEGQSITFNGTVYDENNNSGTETLVGQAVNGCDSVVTVTLSFLPSAQGNFETTICENESIVFNGTTYDINNTTGSEVLAGQAANGCDSIVEVNINFFPPAVGNFTTTICETEEIVFNGTTYDINNSSGTEMLTGQGANGCDSLVNVQINFFPLAQGNLDLTICETEDFTFNGTIYNINNPSGTETLTGQAANGCDSLVSVNLSFFPPATGDFETTICETDNIVFNGTIYDINNATGTETLAGQAANGCDSIVNVQVNFFPTAIGDFETTICETGNIVFNGTTYDINNTTGTETLVGQAANGCDSIVNVQINFFPPAEGSLAVTICEGENFLFNGTTYDANNTSGTETLVGQSANGCDSIVTVNIDFFPPAIGDFNTEICPGSNIVFNGTTYDENNTNGTEILTGQSVNGCDSIVNVSITFSAPVVSLIEETFCSGAVLTVNGTDYNENNPSGTEVLPGAAANGCDSTIQINLQFITTVEVDRVETLCPGESITVNGVIYDENNPSGTELIPGGGGICDSLITVDLSFFPVATGNLNLTICPDSEVNINGTIYDINNPSGVETLANASVNGCDSILNVQLTFEALTANLKAFPPTCFGESNGTINIESLTGGQGPYRIALMDGNFEPVTSLPYNFGSLPAGDYQVRIRDVNDCEFTQAVTIPTPVDLQVSLGEDVSIRLGDSVQLQAITNLDGVQVSWDPSMDLSCADCLEPIAKPLATTIYTVTVSNNGDCATSDDIRIIVDPDPPVYMANAFSPNGDGVNDFFTVQADGILQNIQYFGIFDRWGNLIFERNNFAPNTQENSWDGTYRLQEAPVGVYVYFVEILQPNGRLFKITGDVLLNR